MLSGARQIPRSDVDVCHAGGNGGLDSQVAVFVDEAVFGGDVDELGGFEEQVGCGFAMGDVAHAHDHIEEVFDADDG